MNSLSAIEIAQLVGLPTPTCEQIAVIEAELTPAVVVAGAGSGKTETMAARVVWLIVNEKVEPRSVLGLTFTRKGARELAHRVTTRLEQVSRHLPLGIDPVLDAPTFHTYNGYAASIVADHGLRIGVNPTARIITAAAQWQLLTDLVVSYEADLQTDKTTGAIVEALVALSSQLAEHHLSVARARARLERLLTEFPTGGPPADIDQDRATQELRLALLPLVARYQEVKSERGLMDYADQIGYACQIALAHAVVGETERQRFKCVLLDEFQDTSFAQLELLRALFAVAGHAVTAVGDPNQAIYGWRGASSGGLIQFGDTFRTAQGERARRFTLSRSFRNSEAVLRGANQVAKGLGDWGLPKLEERDGADEGIVTSVVTATAPQEAAEIAAWIAERRSEGEEQPSCAVLCRKRKQFPEIMAALAARDIPAVAVGLGGLLEHPAVVQVVALLTASADPSRSDALMRLLTADGTELGLGDIAALGAHRRTLDQRTLAQRATPKEEEGHFTRLQVGHSLVDVVAQVGEEKIAGLSRTGEVRVARISKLLARARARLRQRISDQLEAAIADLGVDIETQVGGKRDGALTSLVDVVQGFERDGGATMRALIEWFEVAREQEGGLGIARLTVPGAVEVLTVHAAKGLEWDYVAIAGLSEGLFTDKAPDRLGDRNNAGFLRSAAQLPPSLRGDAAYLPSFVIPAELGRGDYSRARRQFTASNGENHFQEDRRLAYVAVTRAKHDLLVTHHWWGQGEKPLLPAPFASEIAPDIAAALQEGPGEKPATTQEAVVANYPRRQTCSVGTRAAQAVQAALARREQGAAAVLSGEVAELADLAQALQGAEPKRQLAPPKSVPMSALSTALQDPLQFRRDAIRPIPTYSRPAGREGTRLHAWIEQYYQGAPTLFDDETWNEAECETKDDFIRSQRNFLASRFANMHPIEIEQAVTVTVEHLVLHGRIDAVFSPTPDKFLIVDWKSGRIPQGAAAHRAAAQLAAYRIAFAAKRGVAVDAVDALFYYTWSDTEVRPRNWPDVSEIAALLAQPLPVES